MTNEPWIDEYCERARKVLFMAAVLGNDRGCESYEKRGVTVQAFDR